MPNPQWHDAIFTQFAARKTNFDMPILDSQNIGEAVTNGVDPRPHGLREEEHRHVASTTRTSSRRTASTRRTDGRGQPGRQDLRPAAARRHVVDGLAQGPHGRHASRHVGGHDRRGQEVPGGEPRHERPRVPPGRHRRRRGRDLQRRQRALRRRAVERRRPQDRRRHQRRRRQEGDGRPRQPDGPAHAQGLEQLVHRRGQRRDLARARSASASSGSPPWAACSIRRAPSSARPRKRSSKKLGLRAAAQAGHGQGAARRHGSARLEVHPGGEAGRGAELHQVVPDAGGPEEVGAARRRAGP